MFTEHEELEFLDKRSTIASATSQIKNNKAKTKPLTNHGTMVVTPDSYGRSN
jgi:hypothetical protein